MWQRDKWHPEHIAPLPGCHQSFLSSHWLITPSILGYYEILWDCVLWTSDRFEKLGPPKNIESWVLWFPEFRFTWDSLFVTFCRPLIFHNHETSLIRHFPTKRGFNAKYYFSQKRLSQRCANLIPTLRRCNRSWVGNLILFWSFLKNAKFAYPTLEFWLISW